MAALKAGDKIQVVVREVTTEDQKSGLYYSYFGGLTGTVDRIYDDGFVCVDVDLDSLRTETRERHLAMQETERKKWLDGLSSEARNRLTPEQKQLKLSYKILVSSKDTQPNKGGKPNGGKNADKSPEAASDDSPSAPKGPARAPEPKMRSSAHAAEHHDEPTAKRASEEDLSKAEEEYLKSLHEKS